MITGVWSVTFVTVNDRNKSKFVRTIKKEEEQFRVKQSTETKRECEMKTSHEEEEKRTK